MGTASIAAKGTGEKTVEVKSASRPGVSYGVRLDADGHPKWCPCPSYGNCWHKDSLLCHWCLGYGTVISYPKLNECPVCSGSGLAEGETHG